MQIRVGYEKEPGIITLDDHSHEVREYNRSKYKEYRVFVTVIKMKLWAREQYGKKGDIIRKGHKYKGQDVINTDINNPQTQRFEKQSGGYEDGEYDIVILEEDINKWVEDLKSIGEL